MKPYEAELQLLRAIQDGQQDVKGDDYEICRRLIQHGWVKAISTSNLRDGDSFGAATITPVGREELTR